MRKKCEELLDKEIEERQQAVLMLSNKWRI